MPRPERPRSADAVRVAIGPEGRNVVPDRKFGAPPVTDDVAGDGPTAAPVLGGARRVARARDLA